LVFLKEGAQGYSIQNTHFLSHTQTHSCTHPHTLDQILDWWKSETWSHRFRGSVCREQCVFQKKRNANQTGRESSSFRWTGRARAREITSSLSLLQEHERDVSYTFTSSFLSYEALLEKYV